MDTIVESELELKLVISPERSVPVPARLTYRTDDPYAVHITFHLSSTSPVRWTFARELLVEGVFRPCGQGDVRVWPAKVDSRSVICMALTSPDGDALVEAPSATVSAWLERTLRSVAAGSEHEALDMDAALSKLLTPAPGDDEPYVRGPWPSDGSDAVEAETAEEAEEAES